MGKIIIEVLENIEETIKVNSEKEFDEAVERIRKRLKRLQLKEKLNQLIGSFEIEEDVKEEDFYSRGKYE
ncbi:MAG: hypothetical protein GXO21_01660 [Aquificae bacterium]|nr:hypothetical protein [Aquificota bacterium]